MVDRWVVVVYETESRFRMQAVEDMIAGFTSASSALGMFIAKRPVHIMYSDARKTPAQVRVFVFFCVVIATVC